MYSLHSQDQYLSLMRDNSHRNLKVEVHLYNMNRVKIDILTGKLIDGNINLSSSSNYRRTASVSFILDHKLLPRDDGRIWLDKMVDLRIGVQHKGSYVWFKMGYYGISKATPSRSLDRQNISLELLDLMAFLDGTLGGELTHTTKLEAKKGMKISDIISQSVSQLPEISIEKLMIGGEEALLPYDMEFNRGDTIYNIIKSVTDLFMSQEFFFDVDGVFKVRQIDDKRLSPVIWDFSDSRMDLLMNISRPLLFSNIRNAIYVWGAFKEDTGEQYFYKYTNKYARNSKSDLLKITDMEEGDLCLVKDEKTSYLYNGKDWNKVDFIVVEEFNVENIGLRNKVVDDNNIISKEQLPLRAEYELKNVSHFAENISITCLPIYLLDVNNKVHIIDEETGVFGDFLIKDISCSLGVDGTMSISAEKIYY